MKDFNILGKGTDQNTYDAIVVGSGMTGGIAAKELTEKGLKVLVLERGRMVEHVKDYSTALTDPWDMPLRNMVSEEEKKDYEIQKTLYLFGQDCKHFLVKDSEIPYNQVKPFNWYRGNQMGGRSLLWSKHVFRLSDYDFEANQKEGIGIDWPIRYKDIAPWYDHVESYIGVSGNNDGIPQLPDGQFLPPFEMNMFEKRIQKRIKEAYDERNMIISRMAILTKEHNGRGKCQNRNLCHRGCVFGAYYSSNSVSLPDAAKTGNLTMRPYSIVERLIYDTNSNKLKGVHVINSETGESEEFYAKLIFLNSSTLGSTQILMQSATTEYPDGLANSSGVLGHYLMDHHAGIGATGGYSGLQDSYYHGNRPASVYIPRFRNIGKNDQDYVRGFSFENYTSRANWSRGLHGAGLGAEWKEGLTKPGNWSVYFEAYGETLPEYENQVSLSKTQKDKWGLPVLDINMEYGENEKKMREDMQRTAVEMLEASDLDWVSPFDYNPPPGSVIHEMGTARMGNDPKTSVLNKWNQSHDIKNLFVTDGSCMPSSPPQNPSLTYMALTARACDYAVESLKKGEI
ncbi:GMC family oxidoreductase [Flammeovirgaceae bacterium SG7u.111]|nr:GMC family oxidoreductase [Flammeovirgaceae bacterium SG7u.132]WPO36605.1 GMC family oxidoreductase [Flammeovirgaceae bacterium SG7u.111]